MRRHTIARPRVSGRSGGPERAEPLERAEPPERAERLERAEPLERAERLERAEPPERAVRPDRPERATRKGRETDEAFREAARTVFARDGYLNAKISDIAAEAGKSVASFYNYYDTKADLLIALAEEFHAEATQMAVLPYRSGLTRQEALREAVAGFWRTYAKRRGELIGVFQAAMLDEEFLDRWLDIRAEAVARIARQIRQAQSEGFCPGVDPVLTASALSAMLEHFCYIWLGQGGERAVVQFDDERAIDTLAAIWVNSVYWRPERPESRSGS